MRTRIILFLLLAAAVASAAFLLFQKEGTASPVARITRDGVLLEEIDLDRLDRPRSLKLEDESGYNVVLAEHGRICVSEADCPDRICVNQGWISDGSVPVVCLPHRLMIEIVDGGGGLDGGAG